MFWEGETFLISGRRPRGLLTRYLPIVDTMPCVGIARAVSKEEVHLRLLRNPPLPHEERIIGEVQSLTPASEAERWPPTKNDQSYVYEWAVNPPPTHTPLAGARVRVTSSSSNTIVTTDSHGVYEVRGLPPDDYTVSLLDKPANQVADDSHLQKKYFLPGRPLPTSFVLDWNGTIDGRVLDAAGNPADVFLELENPDGTAVRVSSDHSGWFVGPTRKTGSFHFQYLAPDSRYTLRLNSFGPHSGSPFAPDARILDLKPEAPHQNVDFTVRPLPERTVRVRALSSSGQPIQDAWISLAYEHTEAWNDLIRSPQIRQTDRQGIAQISVFGDFHVRLRAEQLIEDLKAPPWFFHRLSAIAEVETSKLPQSLDLIVSPQLSQ